MYSSHQIRYTRYKSISPEVIADLQLAGSDDAVYERLCGGDGEFNKLNITELASSFSTDKKFLRDTQRVMKKGVSVPVPGAEICGMIREIENEGNFSDRYGYFGMEMFQRLNRSSFALLVLSMYSLVCPLLSLLLPLVLVLLPLLVLKLHGRAICFEEYLPLLQASLRRHALRGLFEFGVASWERRGAIVASLMFYVLQVYLNVTACYHFVCNMEKIHHVIGSVDKYLSGTVQCMDFALDNWSSRRSYAPFLEDLRYGRHAARELLGSLRSVQPYTWSLGKLFNLGITMQRWYLLNTNPSTMSLLNYCRKFNSYMHNVKSISGLIHSGTLGKAHFTTNTTFKGVRHPSIAREEAVANDVCLNKNLIITGPNAAGKTTIVKASLISIVLSQQLGYGFYRKATINPYAHIHSYINIPDTNGRDSLFQAEAGRCKDILEVYSKFPNERHICVFDELFSGTNPYEAIGAATGFLKHLNRLPNMSYLLTTHFQRLCSIDDENQCVNMQMAASQGKHQINYSFKIKDGVSKGARRSPGTQESAVPCGCCFFG